jgi:two-component system OmpR family sensor kinase
VSEFVTERTSVSEFVTEQTPLSIEQPVRTPSLRRRIVLSVLAMLLVVMLGLGWVVNYLLGSSLRADLRQRLSDRAGYAAVLQQQGIDGQDLADRMTGQGVNAIYSSENGRFFGNPSGVTDPNQGRPGPRPGPLPRPAREPRTTVSEVHGQLIDTVSLTGGTLTLSTSEDAITRTVQSLRQIELIAGAITLLVISLVLLVLVRAALAPLERMSALARRIRDGARGRRLRPTQPGTELGQTAAALDSMLDALESAEHDARTAQAAAERAERSMRQFLGDASHDLRTPLAGVITTAEQLLRDETSRAVTEERLVRLVRQAQRAARLVDDLLLLSRLDGGQAQPPRRELVDLALLIAALRSRYPDQAVDVRSCDGAVIAGDPSELDRALGNLMDNAVAAGGPRGRVSIELCRVGERIAIRVGDDGAGVPAADRGRIFDRFVRLNASRNGPGTGLGLPIARGIARAHGGELSCDVVATGARFSLELPLLVCEPARLPG